MSALHAGTEVMRALRGVAFRRVKQEPGAGPGRGNYPLAGCGAPGGAEDHGSFDLD